MLFLKRLKKIGNFKKRLEKFCLEGTKTAGRYQENTGRRSRRFYTHRMRVSIIHRELNVSVLPSGSLQLEWTDTEDIVGKSQKLRC